MLNEKRPSELLGDEYEDVLIGILDELHATVTEHARALAGGAVAEASEGDALGLVHQWLINGPHTPTSVDKLHALATAIEVERAQCWGRVAIEAKAALTSEQRAHEATKEHLKGELTSALETIAARNETIATLTRERDEALSQLLATQQDRHRIMTDRDRLQAELGHETELRKGGYQLLLKAEAELAETKARETDMAAEFDRQLATVRGELEGYKTSYQQSCDSYADLHRECLKAERELKQLRAQSSDWQLRSGLEGLERKMARANANPDGWLWWVRELLAAHPAPTSQTSQPLVPADTRAADSPADGDRVAPSGEESGLSRHGYTNVHVGSHEFRMLPDTRVLIGAHTMTVAEWEGLATTHWDCEGVADVALRARIEKAAAKVDHALQWDMSNHPRNVFREVREILTSDQPPGEDCTHPNVVDSEHGELCRRCNAGEVARRELVERVCGRFEADIKGGQGADGSYTAGYIAGVKSCIRIAREEAAK